MSNGEHDSGEPLTPAPGANHGTAAAANDSAEAASDEALDAAFAGLEAGDTGSAGEAAGEGASQEVDDDELRSVSQSIPLTPEMAAELLGKVNLFAGLPALYLTRLAGICDEERHITGSLLFKEGDPGDKLYLILEGAVRISRTVPGMGEEALAVLKEFDYFGEMALIDDFPRSADARVHADCRLVVIGKDKLQDLLFVDRELAYDLLWTFVRTLSGRLRSTNDKMTFMAVTSKF